ncbi:hypothetical protein OHA70_37480 [Kribbella sp. NBC_00382]|uniref:hypothetical protein n=1 Tax=Kribbella sp. NBC_00382 TaxID=2975967 RepID=UPI002E2478C8
MSVAVLGVVVVLLVLITLMFVPLKAAPEVGLRSAGLWRWAGVGVGLVAGGVVAWTLGPDRGLLLAAPVFSLGVVLGVVLGELRTPRPAGPVRRAAVETRSAANYLPRRLAASVAVAGIVELALLLWTTSVASADSLGRAGRALSRTCGDMTATKSPWPGSFYSVPLGIAVVLGLLSAAVGIRRVVGRPRPVDAAGELVADDHARRLSATAITGACGVLITVPLLGTTFVAIMTLTTMQCVPTSWQSIGWALLVPAAGGLALLVWSATAVLQPSGQPHVQRTSV